MIVVDSSAWIDFWQSPGSVTATAVDKALAAEEVVVGDLIMVEVLQGLREEWRIRSTMALMAQFRNEVLCGPLIAEIAAANYRLLRRQGITIRGTIDVIIATWCIEHDAAIIHNDRDMHVMEEHLGLRVYA